MSTPSFGKYHFLSWARRGIGASINSGPSGSDQRVSVSVQLSVNAQLNGNTNTVKPAAMQVEVLDARDVTGIDPQRIIRTEPLDGTMNFEPNYLCAVEFSVPDLPWMYSPAGPTGSENSSAKTCPSGDRLVPWLALIVLRQNEFTPPTPPVVNVIQVQTLSALQDLSDSWNWAHVQISGDKSLTDNLGNHDTSPNVIARLICQRRLDPQTSYSAFLVPAFQAGVLKAMGQDSSKANPTDPAWTHDDTKTKVPLSLPVFPMFVRHASDGTNVYKYSLDFQTSDEGDFESLVRRLNPVQTLPDTVGKRWMDVSVPGLGVPSAGPPLGLEGSLSVVGAKSTPWNPPGKDAFQSQVQSWINQTTPPTVDLSNPQTPDPLIVPPIYGRWPAAAASVDRNASGWLNELNLDPRYRAAAGLGTQVVQKDRTKLLASAWQQVEGIIKANQAIKQAQLARASLQQLYKNKIAPASTDTLLTLTSPVHARILESAKTVRAHFRGSRVPERTLSAIFRRVTRPRRRLTPAPAKATPLLQRINSGKIKIVPEPKPPQGMVSIDHVSDQREHSLERRLIEILAAVELARRRSHGITRRFFMLLLLGVTAVGIGAGIAGVAVWDEIEDLFEGKGASKRLRKSGFTPKEIASIPRRPNFVLTTPGTPLPHGTAGGPDSAPARAFRTATSQLFTAFQAHPKDPQPPPSLNLGSLHKTVVARINPTATVQQRMKGLITFARLNWQPRDLLASPILAAPEFLQPMYFPLEQLSPSYLLPGAEAVPRDSVSLVVQNHKFIESYMAGVNDEMTRQLIWEDYPTFNQQATYFRQFWDVSAYVPQNGDPTDSTQLKNYLLDIPPIQNWGDTPLGSNVGPKNAGSPGVVLLVRGELFRRYPNTIVYAVKATRNSDGTPGYDDSVHCYPTFRGTLPTDITFLGFNLTTQDACNGSPNYPLGVYFVFQQPPSEPRFGLEPVETSGNTTKWSELGWPNFATNTIECARKLASLGTNIQKLAGHSTWRMASQVFSTVLNNVDLPKFLSANHRPQCVVPLSSMAAPDKNNDWGQNSAQTAYILFRLPFRILMHACLLLPHPQSTQPPGTSS
jgi:hypothetical protein